MIRDKNNWQPVASREVMQQRARLLKSIRAFFDERDVLEVETPVISSAGSTDPHIESFQIAFQNKKFYLNTSPEYSMKRMLAEHAEPIYQVCKVFRDDELGPNHNPEFTLLEWYRPGFELHQLMEEVTELLRTCFEAQNPDVTHLSYRQAFEKFAGFDPHQATLEECRRCATERHIEQPVGLANDKDEWLDWLLTQLVMPAFNPQGFTFMHDYPASQCALAQLAIDDRGVEVARRFELFYGEVELANGFHELQSSAEQQQRFERENQSRLKAGQQAVRIDRRLLDAMEEGLPDCSGVAIGLDRLLMVLCQQKNIENVLVFPFLQS